MASFIILFFQLVVFNKQANGAIHFLDSDGTKLSNVAAGALPDMVTFTSDCGYALSANEGEPDIKVDNTKK